MKDDLQEKQLKEAVKIAVPWDANRVNQHYGRTTVFAVFEVLAGKVREIGLLDTDPAKPFAAALKAEGVQAVICGGIGPGARKTLEDAGIELIAGASGIINEQVEAWAAGTLRTDDRQDGCHDEHCAH